MRLVRSLIPVFLFLLSLPLAAQNLEIHYIDVGWGGSVFIKGPTDRKSTRLNSSH